MNAESFALVVFFSILFLLAQIRFFRRFISLKKRYENLPGVMLLAGILGDCCCFACEFIACFSNTADVTDAKERHEEKVAAQRRKDKLEREEKRLTRSTMRLSEIESEGPFDELSNEKEESKIKKLVSNKQKTSLQWISAVTMIPIERVIEILTEDPNFLFEDDSVLNQNMLTESESSTTKDSIVSVQDLRERKEKIAKGICPTCNNPFESNRVYCSNCGYVLK